MQRDAAEAPEGPLMVLGGPGTGKTHVMIARMANLIRGGASPHNITYVTFASRGAEDTRNQLAQLPEDLRELTQHVFVGTLHYYASHFLRRAGAITLGLSPQFTIWDPEETREVMMELIKENELEKKLELGDLQRIIDWYQRNQAREPEEAESAKTSAWLELMDLYTAEKRRQNTLDLSELIPVATMALEQDQRLRDAWARNRSLHLLVDEFQDITPRQYHMINLMTGPTRSIMVTADPNQSIFSWRGADPRILNQIQLDHRNIGVHVLRMNHRCTQTLTNAATTFSNHPRIEGLTNDFQNSVRPPGPDPLLREFEGKHGPMDQMILDQVETMHDRGAAWEDMAFIYRSNTTANRLRASMKTRGIPFTVLGETWKGENNNTRCVTNMLASALNPMDLRAFRIATAFRTNTKYRRLNANTSQQISQTAREMDLNIIQAAGETIGKYQLGGAIQQEIGFAVKSWENLNEAINDPSQTLPGICRLALATLHYEQGEGPVPTIEPPMARLLSLSEMTPRLARENTRQHIARFLELLSNSLYPTHRSTENEDPFAHQRGITMSTIHSSKSLQWKMVWIIDITDDVIPGRERLRDREQLLEMQRLFYVAITRATDELYFYCCNENVKGRQGRPSEFLDIIDNCLDRESIETEFKLDQTEN